MCLPPELRLSKRFCGRQIKLSDFLYNFMERHLKLCSVSSDQGCCHDNAFVEECFAKQWQFS